jgi:DNA polymerase III epsilon subunit family exonuclease
MTQRKWHESYIAFDTETTGVGTSARILEIGVAVFENGVMVQEWSQLLKPSNVDWADDNVKKAMSINNITDTDLFDKPTFEEVLPDIFVAFTHDVWVAHNASFDMRMLHQELARLKRPVAELQPKLLACTMTLAAHITPDARVNKLGEVAARYKVTQNGAHRAAADAQVCGGILAAMVREGRLPHEEAAMAEFSKKAEADWKSRRRY